MIHVTMRPSESPRIRILRVAVDVKYIVGGETSVWK